jgi:ribosomal protein S17E
MPINKLLLRYTKSKNIQQEEAQQIWSRIIKTLPHKLINPKEKDDEEQNIDFLTGKFLISQMSDYFSKKLNRKISNFSLKKYSKKLKNKTLKSL